MDHSEDKIKLSLTRLKSGLQMLAESCKLENNIVYEVTCYFKRTENDFLFDAFVVKVSDKKLCRRKFPRTNEIIKNK